MPGLLYAKNLTRFCRPRGGSCCGFPFYRFFCEKCKISIFGVFLKVKMFIINYITFLGMFFLPLNFQHLKFKVTLVTLVT